MICPPVSSGYRVFFLIFLKNVRDSVISRQLYDPLTETVHNAQNFHKKTNLPIYNFSVIDPLSRRM